MVPRSAKRLANNTKKKIMIAMALGENTTACQCLFTYSQASPDEKKSFPFYCFSVTRLSAVDASMIQITQAVIPR